MTGDKVEEEVRRAASVIGATLQGWVESEDRRLGPVLRLRSRAARSDLKKGGVAGLSNKAMAGSAAGGVRKRWREAALLKTVALKDEMPVGASGQGSNFLVMSAKQADAAFNMRVLIGWFRAEWGSSRCSSGAAPRTAGVESRPPQAGVHADKETRRQGVKDGLSQSDRTNRIH